MTTQAQPGDLVKIVKPPYHTHTHTHKGVLFGACQLVTLHTQPKAKQARTSVTSTTRAAPGLVNPLPGTTSRVTQNVRNHA